MYNTHLASNSFKCLWFAGMITKIIDNRFNFDKECRQDVFMGYPRLGGLHKALLVAIQVIICCFISCDRSSPGCELSAINLSSE